MQLIFYCFASIAPVNHNLLPQCCILLQPKSDNGQYMANKLDYTAHQSFFQIRHRPNAQSYQELDEETQNYHNDNWSYLYCPDLTKKASTLKT